MRVEVCVDFQEPLENRTLYGLIYQDKQLQVLVQSPQSFPQELGVLGKEELLSRQIWQVLGCLEF